MSGAHELTMVSAPLGKRLVVSAIDMADARAFAKISALGILPGVEIELRRRGALILFEVYHSRFAIDRQLAEHIYVREL